MPRKRCDGQAFLVAYSAAVLRQISVACIPGSWSDWKTRGHAKGMLKSPKEECAGEQLDLLAQ